MKNALKHWKYFKIFFSLLPGIFILIKRNLSFFNLCVILFVYTKKIYSKIIQIVSIYKVQIKVQSYKKTVQYVPWWLMVVALWESLAATFLAQGQMTCSCSPLLTSLSYCKNSGSLLKTRTTFDLLQSLKLPVIAKVRLKLIKVTFENNSVCWHTCPCPLPSALQLWRWRI